MSEKKQRIIVIIAQEKSNLNVDLFNRPVEVDGVNDVAAILCSSGTTGPFKGTKLQ